ncbi:uncharacterized protein LOC112035250 [Quercus suber]|uniref:uncharacterized protein LOC112035250 n=1 Tax=Quercus suber TaxID=58331 RepID=UPI000CE22D40|nr:uncharacterized protein LOC112035250 [Quercus suber]POE96346.1 hypothetical protein CFP56_56668 [Quercus suber]
MAHESQELDEKLWPPHIEQIFIEIMLDEQLKGNMENGVFKPPVWESITKQLNTQTEKNFLTKKGDPKVPLLRKKGCPHYDKLRQLFASTTATGALQISSNTPAPDSNEERALKEALANDDHCTQVGHDDYYSPNLDEIPRDESPFNDQTQHPDKRPIQDSSGKGKKPAKKVDRVSEMTTALQEYTAMTRERYSQRKGKAAGSSDHCGQSATIGDPCSLGKAIQLLNQHKDLDDDAYFAVSTALHLKKNRVVFMGMPEHRRKRWMDLVAKQKGNNQN